MLLVKVNKPHVLHWNSMDHLFSEWSNNMIQQYHDLHPLQKKGLSQGYLMTALKSRWYHEGFIEAYTAGTAGPLDEYAEDVSERRSLAWKQILHPCRETNL